MPALCGRDAATACGRVLAVKFVLFAAMAALAVRNRLGGDHVPSRSIAAETVCGAAVVAAAALLGVTAPN